MASRLTATKRKLFLTAYAKLGAITLAAKAAGVAHSIHYVWLEDPEYAAAFAEAEKEAISNLEAELFSRVYEGTEEPVVYQGELSYQKDAKGKITDKPLTIRRKSDTLLIFALKGKKPEVYRDNFKGEITHTGVMDIHATHSVDLTKLSNEQLDVLDSLYQAAAADNGPAAETIPVEPFPGKTEESKE